MQPDPEPLRNEFIRSDQYSFIRQGIPAVAMKVGYKPGFSPEEVTAKKWLHERYHAPSDDLNQPVDLAAAGKFEDIVQDLTVMVANDPGSSGLEERKLLQEIRGGAGYGAMSAATPGVQIARRSIRPCRGTAGPSTTLRSGRDDTSKCQSASALRDDAVTRNRISRCRGPM